MSRESDHAVRFRVIIPHTIGGDHDWHQWYFPNGHRGVGPTERRDSRGAAQGNRKGFYPEWFVLACNNTECSGRAVVPVSIVTDIADIDDPAVTA